MKSIIFVILVFGALLGFMSGVQASQLDCEKKKKDERICMQCNLYHEARGLSNIEQLMVGLTTLERVKSSKYPDTICKVVWQPYQFSWTNDGRSDKIKEKKSWKNIGYVVDLLMMAAEDPNIVVLPDNVSMDDISEMMWYHAHHVSPKWAKKKRVVANFDGHVYYKAE